MSFNEIIDAVTKFFEQSLFEVAIELNALGVWLVLYSMLFFAGLTLLRIYKAGRYTKDWNFILLAIDIPAMNIQTPKAVEQLFAHVFSIMEVPSIGAYYRRGFIQEYYSFEIVSIEGYIQFIIYVRDKYRNVVEAAVYAQYPEAEITEIEDYTKNIPSMYPNDTHKIWGADFKLIEHWAYPIRMYSEFEHSISKDTVLKDPMGTFLESFSRIGPGEQMWYQIIIEPIQESRWKKAAIKEIKKLIGAKEEGGGSKIADAITGGTMKALEALGDEVFNREGLPGGASAEKFEPPNQMLYLTPGQKKTLEGMEEKISKIGFKTKVRAMYVARKEVYNPSRGVNSLVGAINQFNIPTSNMLLPKYITSTMYFWKRQRDERRRRILMSAFKRRNLYDGKDPYIMNIEELATIWHFPMSHVKTPLVQKAAMKAAEPPSGLPVEGVGAAIPGVDGMIQYPGQPAEAPQDQKTYTTDSGDVGTASDIEFG